MRTENWLRSFTVTPPGTDLLPWTRKIRPDRKRSWKAQVFFARPRFLFVQNRIVPCPRTIHLQICIKKTATHRCKKHHGQGIACSGRDLDFADKTHCIHPSFETAARIPVCSRPVQPGQQGFGTARQASGLLSPSDGVGLWIGVHLLLPMDCERQLLRRYAVNPYSRPSSQRPAGPF